MAAIVTVEGLKELGMAFSKLKRDIRAKALKNAARDSARLIKEKAKMNVPVDTGNLKKGILSRTAFDGLSDVVGIVTLRRKSFYGKFVELGYTKRGDAKKRSTRKGGAHVPAQPFLRPAIDESFDETVDFTKRELNKAVLRNSRSNGN